MRAADPQPDCLTRLAEVNDAFIARAFEDAAGDEASLVEAIGAALACDVWLASRKAPFDSAKLQALGSRLIDEAAFFGDWLDLPGGQLLKRGSGETSAGRLTDPPLVSLEGLTVGAWGVGHSWSAGDGGQFAYAFSDPPYGLGIGYRETQALFEAVRASVLPPGEAVEIRDWASPRLPEVSPYFAAGMEWWGVFLFTIHVPALKRLTVLAASATD